MRQTKAHQVHLPPVHESAEDGERPGCQLSPVQQLDLALPCVPRRRQLHLNVREPAPQQGQSPHPHCNRTAHFAPWAPSCHAAYATALPFGRAIGKASEREPPGEKIGGSERQGGPRKQARVLGGWYLTRLDQIRRFLDVGRENRLFIA